MNIIPHNITKLQSGARLATCLTGMLAVAALAGQAVADPPYTMAPPIQSTDTQAAYDAPGNASQDSVFNWAEVPQNQEVPIRRAVFDQGGYQLYDTAGETIIVPFSNQNLYVMKFGLSRDGSTYFINTGDTPVLYVPKGGSLENASVPGARWYPFAHDFHPAEPVFLGIAPSYHDFIGMGWYPDMYAYGGYYSHHSFLEGGIFLPSIGLSFVIGNRPYDGWEPYHHYYYAHPAPYRVTIVNNNIYHISNRHDNVFYGSRQGGFRGRSFGGDHASAGSDHNYNGNRDSSAHRTFSGGQDYESVRTSHTDTGHSFGGEHTFQGTRTSDNAGRGNSQGYHSFSGSAPHQQDSQTRPVFTGSRNGDSQSRPVFGGGNRQNDSQTRPAFSGGQRDSGNTRPVFTGGRERSDSQTHPVFTGGGQRGSYNSGDTRRSAPSDTSRHGSANDSGNHSASHDSSRNSDNSRYNQR